jgi:hypothetical protein
MPCTLVCFNHATPQLLPIRHSVDKYDGVPSPSQQGQVLLFFFNNFLKSNPRAGKEGSGLVCKTGARGDMLKGWRATQQGPTGATTKAVAGPCKAPMRATPNAQRQEVRGISDVQTFTAAGKLY